MPFAHGPATAAVSMSLERPVHRLRLAPGLATHVCFECSPEASAPDWPPDGTVFFPPLRAFDFQVHERVVAGMQHPAEIREERHPKAPKKSETGDF
jgi:hypothetical protein